MQIVVSSIVHWYTQYGWCGWRHFHALGYHTYLIIERHNLKNKVAIAYGARFAVRKDLAPDSLKEGGARDVGGRNKDDKSDKEKRENEDSAVESLDTAEIPY